MENTRIALTSLKSLRDFLNTLSPEQLEQSIEVLPWQDEGNRMIVTDAWVAAQDMVWSDGDFDTYIDRSGLAACVAHGDISQEDADTYEVCEPAGSVSFATVRKHV